MYYRLGASMPKRYENFPALRKCELETARKTKRDFKQEIDFVELLLNIFLKTFYALGSLLETNRDFTNSEDACYRITFKVFRMVRYAFKSSLEGYYDVTMALLRIAFENHLLLDYLSKNEEEAKLWFEGKTFSPAFLRKRGYYSGHSLYREMSEFIHSSFKSTHTFTRLEKGDQKGILGEYDKNHCEKIFPIMIMTLFTTIVWITLKFPELAMNEEWKSFSWDGIIRIAKYIRNKKPKQKA